MNVFILPLGVHWLPVSFSTAATEDSVLGSIYRFDPYVFIDTKLRFCYISIISCTIRAWTDKCPFSFALGRPWRTSIVTTTKRLTETETKLWLTEISVWAEQAHRVTNGWPKPGPQFHAQSLRGSCYLWNKSCIPLIAVQVLEKTFLELLYFGWCSNY